MRILADENIPALEATFAKHARLRCMAGRSISPHDLEAVDLLLVRSVTRVDQGLLDGTAVKMVATATAGVDHVDTAYLAAKDIAFAAAPGSNAVSVVEYVLAALLTLALQKKVSLKGKRMGIVGYGQIGKRLAPRVAALGMQVHVFDPFVFSDGATLAAAPYQVHTRFEDLLGEVEVLSFHVPLTRTGLAPTFHLLNAQNIAHLRPDVWVLNASRGGVVEETALFKAKASGHLGGLVLDVWENEPAPAYEVVELADIATPHIAGYSYDAKLMGTQMIYEACCAKLGWETLGTALELDKSADFLDGELPFLPAVSLEERCSRLVRAMYDLSADDQRFRGIQAIAAADKPAFFHQLRKHYPVRYAFDRYHVRVPAGFEGDLEVFAKALKINSLLEIKKPSAP